MSSGVASAPVVSVMMKTFNHERFLSQSLDSVLAQQTDFPFDIVLGEDCSTDRTRALAQEYAARFPEKIRLVLPEKNIGRLPMIAATFRLCTGKYVAILEGDDFWTDPRKLQKQVDILERHKDCAICFHKVAEVGDDGTPMGVFGEHNRARFTLEDLVERRVLIPTCSTLFRNRLWGAELPAWFFTLDTGDLGLHTLNAMHGDIAYLDESMAAYRIHAGGVWTAGVVAKDWDAATRRKRVASSRKYFSAIRPVLGEKYEPIIRGKLSMLEYDLAWIDQQAGDVGQMRAHLLAARRFQFWNRYTSRLFVLKAWVLAFCPFAYRFYRRRQRAA